MVGLVLPLPGNCVAHDFLGHNSSGHIFITAPLTSLFNIEQISECRFAITTRVCKEVYLKKQEGPT